MTSLLDALTRHQIYVEGLKLGQTAVLAKTMRAIEVDTRQRLNGLKYNSLDQMTKAELVAFVSALKVAQSKIYSSYINDLIDFLQQFMKKDRKLIAAIFFGTVGVKADIPDDDRSWSSIINAPIPASGLTLQPFITAFASKGLLDTANLVMRGYANKLTPAQAVKTIVGTSSLNGKDGLTNKIFNGGNAVERTIIQHVTAMGQDQVALGSFEQYQWVSVIDDRTTDICLSRNGNVYTTGNGPLPPAHIRCRSKTIPVFEKPIADSDLPKDFGDWFKDQPDDFIKDVFKDDIASQIIAGAIKRGSVKYQDPSALTLDQFVGKLPFMLEDDDDGS